MKWQIRIGATAFVVFVALSGSQGQTQKAGVPAFQVDPTWPKALPNNWTFARQSLGNGAAYDVALSADP